MKHLLLFLSLIVSSYGFSQTFTTIAEDNASNYSGTGAPNFGLNISDNGGTGFNAWTWSDSGSNKSAFLGHGPNDGHGDIGNPSFGLFAQNDGSSINAYRSFSDLLNRDQLEVEFTINFRAGAKGVEIFQNGTGVFLFQAASLGGDKYEYRDQTGTFINTGWPYQANSIFRLTVTQLSNTNATITVERINSTGHSVTLTNVNISGRVDEIRFFNENAGGGSQNFYFNNLKIERPKFATSATGDFSSASTWAGGVVPDNTEDIFINHDVNLDSDFTLTETLNISSVNTLNVNNDVVLTNNGSIITNGNLVFKSLNSGTAQYGNSSGSITGDITVERFIPAKRAYRLLSSPVGGQTIANAWQQDTHITGTGGASNGFDATSTDNPSLFSFDNSLDPQVVGGEPQSWQAVTSTSDVISAGTPYRLMVRGDRTIDLADNEASATATTLSATGTMYTGSYSPTLATAANNYSFVGNPYQAVVDFGAVTTTNLTGYLYVWDASISGASGNGGYTVVDASDGSEVTAISPYSSSANQYIMPGQAFFVQNNATGNGSITFEEADKATGQTQVSIFSTYTNFYINSRLYKASALQNGEMESDAIGLRFNENYTTIGSDEDASKLANPGENYAIVNNGFKSIDKQNIPTDGHQIDLLMMNYEDTAYSLTFNLGNQPETLKVYLNDNYLNTQTELAESTTYDFSVDANVPESIDQNRFHLSFEEVPLNNQSFDAGQVRLYPNPVVHQLQIELPASVEINSVQVFNTLGQQVLTTTQSQVDVSHLASGVYVVEVETSAGKVSKKIIKQ